mmetsp:Transcript_497/g.1919  ORF Transcript_497/g.1919 Transcript_497/m.1919 type:complete len:455 (-) Transcript_497:461-1825(-)
MRAPGRSASTTKPPWAVPRRFQYVTVGGGHGAPTAARPASAKRRTSRSCCVSHASARAFHDDARFAASNCMSESTRRSGTSSGATLFSMHASRICSIAAAKLVDPPHGARSSLRTFSTIDASGSTACQRGADSKVRTRCRNAGAATSATTSPSAMATCIGTPDMDPDTSTSATTWPRSTDDGLFGCLWCSVVVVCSPSQCSRTPATMASHCASRTSSSSVDMALRVRDLAMIVATSSCGKSCFPLSAFFLLTRASRTCLRHATRSGSSGCRSPVSIAVPARGLSRLSFSLRNACRDLARHRDGTAATSIAAHRLPHILVSVVPSARFSDATSSRYAFLGAGDSPPNMAAASAAAALEPFLPSRGAYLPSSESLCSSSGVVSAAGASSACSERSPPSAAAAAASGRRRRRVSRSARSRKSWAAANSMTFALSAAAWRRAALGAASTSSYSTNQSL